MAITSEKASKNTPAFPRLNTGRKCHEGPLARFKNGYLNLNLQTKFTIALISIVVIPACLTAFLFMDDFIAWWFPIPSGRNRTPPQKLHL